MRYVFSRLHPAVELLFFVLVLGFPMFYLHPALLAASLPCAVGCVCTLYPARTVRRGAAALVPVVLLAAVLILSPIVERSNLMQNRYWITNQRAILMSRDGSFYYMDLADIDTYEVIRGKSDQDCLALGSEIQEDAKKYVRWRSCHPKEDMTGAKERDHVKGLMFYNIANIADAVAQLKKSESSAA